MRRLAEALQAQGHEVSRTVVADLLHEVGYSLQANRKTMEGDSHPDRDAQFEYINAQVSSALAEQQPVISVDTKKKELVGDFKNGGREWRPQGDPEEVRVHDFLITELGRAIPYGSTICAECRLGERGHRPRHGGLRGGEHPPWWHRWASAVTPSATPLLITADGGGSNGSRVRLWKVELQKLADETRA